VEQAAEELISQDRVISSLRSENFKLKQTNQSLHQDLNLSQRLIELRHNAPYLEPEFNGLTYFKYVFYSLLAIGFMITLMRRKEVE
jgi:hypothetical protein